VTPQHYLTTKPLALMPAFLFQYVPSRPASQGQSLFPDAGYIDTDVNLAESVLDRGRQILPIKDRWHLHRIVGQTEGTVGL